jgi:Bacterial Ig-like domain (group 3)/NHL repeat
VKISILKPLRPLAARLLPALSLAVIVATHATMAHAQANFAGSEVNVENWPNAYLSGIAVSPHGDLDICDQADGELHEAFFQTGYEYSYYPDPYGWPNVCPVVGPKTITPMAGDINHNVYFLIGTNLEESVRAQSELIPPTIIASGFTNPTGLVLDPSDNVFVADNGTGQVFKVAIASNPTVFPVAYGKPTAVFSWSGIQYVALDGQGSLYAAGGYGAASGFVVKAHWNGSGYDAPVMIASGLNDITGIAADAAGDIFVSSDDNQESALTGQTYSPAAIVDLWEIPLAPSSPSGYGTPIPLGNGDFYNAQTVQSDAAGDVYVLWIGGPRGSFSYNVEKIDPANPVNFGSVKTNATSTEQVSFWITGTEQLPPTITASTPEFTAGATSCNPDTGTPLNLDGYPVNCSATITFAPQGLATRTGVAHLISGSTSASIATANLTGIGVPTYDANVTIAFTRSTITYPGSTVVTISVYDGGVYSSPAPDGTVTLNIDGTPFTTLTLSGTGHGYAAANYNLTGVAAGQHTLTATYSGGGYGLFLPGTSGPFSLTVLPSPVSLAVSCQNPSIPHGAAYKCEVFTQPVKAGTGTFITYTLDSGAAVSVPLSSGAATFSIANAATGPHSVAIGYAAQGSYAAASTVTESFTVSPPH